MVARSQLTMPSGEPRYTKISGQSRYYDHATGKSISHRQYYKVKNGSGRDADKWTVAKSEKLTSPPPVHAMPRQEAGSPSLLAQQLLRESMPGSPVVETPEAPHVSAMKDLAGEIAEDTKKTVESLAETVTPAVATCIILAAVFVVPEHMAWLIPDQEEAELVVEPAARLLFRNIGLTGKQLGPNGNDLMSLLVALAAYMAGAKQRMDDYLAAVESEPAQYVAAHNGANGASSNGANGNGRREPYRAAPPDATSNGQNAYAAVFGGNTQQVSPAPSKPSAPANVRPIGQGAPATAKQAWEASQVAALFNADYEGRRRLGLAR